EAHARLRRVSSFPIGYQSRTDAGQAVADLRRIDAVLAGSPLEVSLHPKERGELPGLRIYRVKDPVVLSDILPILENLGLRVVAEEPFCIEHADDVAVWIHEFQLAAVALLTTVSAGIVARFEEAVVAVWTGRVENDGFNRLVLAGGLSARQINLMPQPRPLFDIYVYSPRVEWVHMRAGKVARGGIRWSDRKEDFRTEILGLMKAQTVKNAVIVPVGAKGGFVIKQPPASPDG